jgi:hypothetical protein
MIHGQDSGDNIASSFSTGTADASRFFFVSQEQPGEVPKPEPPKVLISLQHVQQMRERKRQIQALQQWAALQAGVHRDA